MMDLRDKRLLFIIGLVIFIGGPIYYNLPVLIALSGNILYLGLILVCIVVLIKLIGEVWGRL